MKHHNVEHPLQSKKILDKMLEHSGRYINPKYPELVFGSSWEFKVYDFLVEHDIEFQFQPDIILPYEFEGKTHFYHPDFLINGKIYEVKGEQFFRKNKQGVEEMCCPRRRKESEQEYERRCSRHRAKHQCMLRNNVVILRGKNIRNLTLELFVPSGMILST